LGQEDVKADMSLALPAVLDQLRSRQFGLFVLASGTAAIVHWTSRILLTFVMPYSIAIVVAYAIGIGIAYVLNMLFVFRNATRPVSEQVRYFILVNVIAFPFVWVAAYVLSEVVFPRVGVTYHPREIAHGIAICLPVVANYLAHKYVTFRELPVSAARPD
jgi:putative flippase GtrA